MLEVKSLKVAYGGALILNGINIEVGSGEVVGVIGPNGAGKTTLLRAISGLVRMDQKRYGNVTFEGMVKFDGERIEKLLPHEIANKGLILCPERRRPFPEMTVIENLKAGAYTCKDKEEIKKRLEIVYALFPSLKRMERRIAGTLSGGEQQMLAIGRALMANPKLLCIDEPTAGLAPKLKRSCFEQIKNIGQTGISVLLVEQDVRSAFKITNRNYVMSEGRIVAHGTAEELFSSETLRKAYLGI
ncbi:MAG: ABC transporter ATP-binding protein [Candidatus Bathyarchaeia archaeon]